MKLTETFEWNHVHTGRNVCGIEKAQYKNDIDTIIGTTPEYFAQLLVDESNVETAMNLLESIGIKVKTEYGNYRPTYDVLKDIGMYYNQILEEKHE